MGGVRRPGGSREGLLGRPPLPGWSNLGRHDVTQLLAAFLPPHQAPPELIELGKRLDKHYLPARYPNGFAAGTPMEHYTRRDAEDAIADGEAIVEFCRRSISG